GVAPSQPPEGFEASIASVAPLCCALARSRARAGNQPDAKRCARPAANSSGVRRSPGQNERRSPVEQPGLLPGWKFPRAAENLAAVASPLTRGRPHDRFAILVSVLLQEEAAASTVRWEAAP